MKINHVKKKKKMYINNIYNMSTLYQNNIKFMYIFFYEELIKLAYNILKLMTK